MAIKIASGSVKLIVDLKDATPAISADKDGLLLHLGKGSKLLKNKETIDDATADNSRAFTISASAQILYPDKTWFASHNFNFIQLARDSVDFRVYAGADPSQGMVEQNLTIPPIVPPKLASSFLLDSGIVADGDSSANAMPFINLNSFSVKPAPSEKAGAGTASCEMGDHPNSRVPAQIRNEVAKRDNYLARIDKSFEAITAFAHKDENSNITILATVRWWITWSIKCKWRGGFAYPRLSAGVLRFDDTISGTTGEPYLDLMITKPNMDINDTYNMVSNVALAKIYKPGVSANVNNEKQTWNDSIPKDFFQ